MINWPDSLVNDIAKNRAVLVLGAGVSMNSQDTKGNRPPDWKTFLTGAMDKLEGNTDFIKSLIDTGDYLTACEIIMDKDKHHFEEYAKECFLRPGYKDHEIHKHIFDLNVQFVITPNVDLIYETYAKQKSHGTIIDKVYYDDDLANCIRGKDKIVIKMHGTIAKPNDMIFTRSQYAKARCDFSSFYTIISSLILTHTFIFIGCGTSDPDIKLLLENYNFIYPGCRPHYFVTSSASNADFIKNLRMNYNLHAIQYSDKDNHKELVLSLNQLVLDVENKREYIAATREW